MDNRKQPYFPSINKAKHIESTQSEKPGVVRHSHEPSSIKNYTTHSKTGDSKKGQKQLQISPHEQREWKLEHAQKQIMQAQKFKTKLQEQFLRSSNKQSKKHYQMQIQEVEKQLQEAEIQLLKLKKEEALIFLKMEKQKNQFQIIQLKSQASINAIQQQRVQRKIKNLEQQLEQKQQLLPLIKQAETFIFHKRKYLMDQICPNAPEWKKK